MRWCLETAAYLALYKSKISSCTTQLKEDSAQSLQPHLRLLPVRRIGSQLLNLKECSQNQANRVFASATDSLTKSVERSLRYSDIL